jgi:hypothetical protein
MNWEESGKKVEESSCGLVKELYQHLPASLEENEDKP